MATAGAPRTPRGRRSLRCRGRGARARGSRRRSRPRGDAMSASPPTSAAAATARLRGHGGVRCTVAVTRFVVGARRGVLRRLR
ncbi:Os10g0478750 [Oryza sativa Japonica Group]|uniref:Os10g0478750 protein n=1 Tax=Oryza sativa subsp. japonica TaxID=39947 RepID=A0A0P0XVS1_ORYSJ|nr:hypothetical protein EE612_051883 [Oryza sativa]BAT11319.1 Os10g0478750 [Oryza sativa Japonica Group]